jgi:LAO/AO transport system kinase
VPAPARPAPSPDQLATAVLEGERRAIARAISLVEDAAGDAATLMRRLWPATGRARIIGLTGPPGVGKSTLASSMVGVLRRAGATIGVVSVDPSSPFTHGALLGDRIRLAEHFVDPGVFIRSMSSRGHLGGLAEATFLATRILDASGKDIVLVETVGVGQSEVEVRSVADVVVLVLQPGSGDSVQALKAGVMEIPDVICINKKDHPEAASMRSELRRALSLAASEQRPRLVETDARSGEGVETLISVVDHVVADMGPTGLAERRRACLTRALRTVAVARATARIEAGLAGEDVARLVAELDQRTLDPITAVDRLMQAVFQPSDGDAGQE